MVESKGWYPVGNYKKYAYASSLKDEDSEEAKNTYNIAINLLNNAHQSLGSDETIERSYTQLQNLVTTERSSEIAFLNKYFKTNFNNETNFSEILKAINEFLNNKNILEDSLSAIEAIDPKNSYKNSNSKLYQLLNDTIPQKIRDICDNFIKQKGKELIIEGREEELMTELSNLLKKEITYLLEQYVRNNILEEDPLLESVEKTLNNGMFENEFIKQILTGYGLEPKQLLASFENRKKKWNNKKIQNLFRITKRTSQKKAGNVFEIFVSEVFKQISSIKTGGQGIEVTVQQTGQLNNMKADQILYFGSVGVDLSNLTNSFKEVVSEETELGNKSVRLQNIKGLKTMLTNLDQAVDAVVEISDKNYKLTSQGFAQNSKYYGGFSAGNSDLEVLENVLSQTPISQNDLENLIFVLVNSGEKTINENDVNDALKMIALNVASFLFDDVAITEGLNDHLTSLQKIHLFNLNGILVPLSIFLQAAADAFSTNQDSLKDYVKVTFSASSVSWPNSDGDTKLTEQDWIKFYNEKLKANRVAVKFFGDFVNFIKQYMKA